MLMTMTLDRMIVRKKISTATIPGRQTALTRLWNHIVVATVARETGSRTGMRLSYTNIQLTYDGMHGLVRCLQPIIVLSKNRRHGLVKLTPADTELRRMHVRGCQYWQSIELVLDERVRHIKSQHTFRGCSNSTTSLFLGPIISYNTSSPAMGEETGTSPS